MDFKECTCKCLPCKCCQTFNGIWVSQEREGMGDVVGGGERRGGMGIEGRVL